MWRLLLDASCISASLRHCEKYVMVWNVAREHAADDA